MTRTLTLPMNVKGRDYVAGDVHGCLDLLQRAMWKVKFDPSRDRLFLVGDYVDRGPRSPDSVTFLKNAFVNPVLGNHEAMILEIYEQGAPHAAVIEFMTSRNGFEWWLETPESTRQDILDVLRKIPVAMETKTVRGTVGFVHADIPRGMHWKAFRDALDFGHEKTTSIALWGRNRIHDNDISGVNGIDRVFVGHTPVRRAMRYGNIVAVDTGAVYGVLGAPDGAMTIADLNTTTAFFNFNEPMERPADMVFTHVETEETVLERPFGRYSVR